MTKKPEPAINWQRVIKVSALMEQAAVDNGAMANEFILAFGQALIRQTRGAYDTMTMYQAPKD